MKKLMILAVVSAFLGTTQLQNTSADTIKTKHELAQEVTYKEISTKEIPEAIKETIDKDYTDYTIGKVYLGSDETYKVELSKAQENLELFLNKKGEVLKTEHPESSM